VTSIVLNSLLVDAIDDMASETLLLSIRIRLIVAGVIRGHEVFNLCEEFRPLLVQIIDPRLVAVIVLHVAFSVSATELLVLDVGDGAGEV
jgi:hypothetical protein